MVALVEEELQIALAVMSVEVPSLNDAVAVNCWVWPVVREGFTGVTEIAVVVGGITTAGEETGGAEIGAGIPLEPHPEHITRKIIATNADAGLFMNSN